MDLNAGVMPFEIVDTATVYLSGRDDINVAIEGVVAIPIDEWDLEMVHPQLKCNRMEQQ